MKTQKVKGREDSGLCGKKTNYGRFGT